MTAVQILADFTGYPLVRVSLWFALIFALVALGIALVRKWRDSTADDTLSRSELLTKFGEVHTRGGLSDDECRTIKTKLAADIEGEISGSDKSS